MHTVPHCEPPASASNVETLPASIEDYDEATPVPPFTKISFNWKGSCKLLQSSRALDSRFHDSFFLDPEYPYCDQEVEDDLARNTIGNIAEKSSSTDPLASSP